MTSNHNSNNPPPIGSRDWWAMYHDDKDEVIDFFRYPECKKAGSSQWWGLVSPRLRQDRDVVKAVILNNKIDSLSQIPVRFFDDKEFVITMLTDCQLIAASQFKYVSNRLHDDKEVVLQAMRRNGMLLKYASNRLQYDRSVVVEAIQNCGKAITLVPSKFCDDFDVILLASQTWNLAFRYASSRLRGDKDMALSIIPIWGNAFDLLSPNLYDDEDVIKIALSHFNGQALEWASERLKASKSVVCKSVSTHGRSLQYADKTLQDDKEVVLLAVRENASSLRFASLRLRSDKEVVLEATTSRSWTMQYASAQVKGDEHFLFQIGSEDVFKYASKRLRAHRPFVSRVVDKYPSTFRFFSDFFGDKEILMVALRSNPSALQHAHCSLQLDPEVIYAFLHHFRKVSSGYSISSFIEEVSLFKMSLYSIKKFRQVFEPFSDRLSRLIGSLEQADSDLLLLITPRPEHFNNKKRLKMNIEPINATNWIQDQWERVWLVSVIFTDSIEWLGCSGVHKSIVEFAKLDKTIKLAKEIKTCEPVVNRLIELQLDSLLHTRMEWVPRRELGPFDDVNDADNAFDSDNDAYFDSDSE